MPFYCTVLFCFCILWSNVLYSFLIFCTLFWSIPFHSILFCSPVSLLFTLLSYSTHLIPFHFTSVYFTKPLLRDLHPHFTCNQSNAPHSANQRLLKARIRWITWGWLGPELLQECRSRGAGLVATRLLYQASLYSILPHTTLFFFPVL